MSDIVPPFSARLASIWQAVGEHLVQAVERAMDVHPAAGAAGSGQGGVGGDQLGGHVWAIAQELDVRAAVGVRGASPGGRVLSEMSGP